MNNLSTVSYSDQNYQCQLEGIPPQYSVNNSSIVFLSSNFPGKRQFHVVPCLGSYWKFMS